MDKGRRTSSIIEKFVYDPSAQELNVSFQDLQYNIENGEMGFFEKEGDICYLSKLEIASSGEKPFTASFTNGDIFGSATIDGALGFVKNGGGGGGGGGNLVLTASNEEDDFILTGASFDEIASAIKDGKFVFFTYVDEEVEGYTLAPISGAFFDNSQDLYVLQMYALGEEMMVYAVNRTDTTWTSNKPTPPTPDEEEDSPPTN